jgi:hypothetical protein
VCFCVCVCVCGERVLPGLLGGFFKPKTVLDVVKPAPRCPPCASCGCVSQVAGCRELAHANRSSIARAFAVTITPTHQARQTKSHGCTRGTWRASVENVRVFDGIVSVDAAQLSRPVRLKSGFANPLGEGNAGATSLERLLHAHVFRASRCMFFLAVQRLTREMLQAALAMEAKGVMHRDIKPENVLLTAELGIRVADFGISRPTFPGAQKEYSTGMVTLWYRAPELLCSAYAEGYTSAVDMWSFGIVVLEMLVGREALVHALFRRHEQAMLRRIFKLFGVPVEGRDGWSRAALGPLAAPKTAPGPLVADRAIFSHFPAIPDTARHFLLSMLTVYPTERACASVALTHPFLS